MGYTVLGTTIKKDVGVKISADMKMSERCGIAVSKGKQIAGFIRRNIIYKEKEQIIPLYSSIAIVRLHLEYCVQVYKSKQSIIPELGEVASKRMWLNKPSCKEVNR